MHNIWVDKDPIQTKTSPVKLVLERGSSRRPEISESAGSLVIPQSEAAELWSRDGREESTIGGWGEEELSDHTVKRSNVLCVMKGDEA